MLLYIWLSIVSKCDQNALPTWRVEQSVLGNSGHSIDSSQHSLGVTKSEYIPSHIGFNARSSSLYFDLQQWLPLLTTLGKLAGQGVETKNCKVEENR